VGSFACGQAVTTEDYIQTFRVRGNGYYEM